MLDFTRYTFPTYTVDKFHKHVAGYLDKVVSGDITRLMVFAPPQHGKSELCSIRLPAFYLGKNPDHPVIISSYAAGLAHRMSRHARNVVETLEFGQLFNVATNKQSRAMDQWELEPPNRGGLVSAGVGGPITGHGAMLGIIDDPFENWEQAHSERIRDKVWDWWRGTFRTRIWEGGAIVLIMTRWHEDDLAGRLLSDQGKEWTVLRLPAIAESQHDRDLHNERIGLSKGLSDPMRRKEGEPLSPSRFTSEALANIRRDVGSQVWMAEYQGAPTLPEGNRFKRAWFPIVDAAPRQAKRVRYWDLAATEGRGARTAGVLMALDGEGIIYIEDVVTGQWSTGKRNKVMVQTAERDAQQYNNAVTIYVEQEPGSSGIDAIKAVIKMLAGFPVHADRATGDKDVRLEPFAAQAEADNVRLVRGSWNGLYIDEMSAVPSGQYRDQADATAGAYNKMARTGVTVASGRDVYQ